MGHTGCGTLPRVAYRRPLAVLLVGAAAIGGLAGCRTSPTVAAYVGDDARVTVADLDAAVAERLADPDIAEYVQGEEAAFTRRVLSLQVDEVVYAEVARRYDVQVSDADVRARIDELLDGGDPEAVFTQVAQQEGASEDDVVENVRQQLIRQQVAVAEGEADVSEDALRTRYEETKVDLSTRELGYVTVPDQATADAVLAQLTADPAGYPAVAAQYPGQATLPQVQTAAPGEVQGVLAEPFAAAGPGQGFTLAVPEAGGIVVGFVAAMTVPTFADVRDDLALQAADEAEQAGAALVDAVRDDLRLTVNPRYGVLDAGQVVPGDGGLVHLLSAGGSGSDTGAAGD